MMSKLSRLIAIAMLSIALAPLAGAQDWPTKTIQLSIGFPPGGPNDLVFDALVLPRHLPQLARAAFSRAPPRASFSRWE